MRIEKKTPVFSLVALAALSGLFANVSQGRQNSATEAVVGNFEVRNGMALRALLDLGLITNEPFGIIEAGDRLCETKISTRSSNEPLGRVLQRTVGQIPGYGWYVRNGVVIIEPNSLPRRSASLLRLVIPRFVAPPSSMSELEVLLGMHIQEVLRPDRGVLGDALVSPAEPKGVALDISGKQQLG